MICQLNTNLGEIWWLQIYALKHLTECTFLNVSLVKNPCLFSDRMWIVIARHIAQHEDLQNIIKLVSTGCPEQHILSPYYQVKEEVLNTRGDFV